MKHNREEQILEAKASWLERKSTAKVLQKIVEKLCPEEDPTDRYTGHKRNWMKHEEHQEKIFTI